LAPHILIKEEIGKKNIPCDFLDYDAVFSDLIVGIYAPWDQLEDLKKLYLVFQENKSYLYRFFIMATSPKLFANMAGVFLKKDIDNLPYPTNNIKLSEVDKIIINDVIMYQFSKKKELLEPANESDISQFSDVFRRALNAMYKSDNREFFLFKMIISNAFFILHYEYGNFDSTYMTEHGDLDVYLKELTPQEIKQQESYRVKKIIKIYGNDRFVIAKPKDKKYWLRSMALRDADETIADYIKARYNDD
jgi:hypothetical protein